MAVRILFLQKEAAERQLTEEQARVQDLRQQLQQAQQETTAAANDAADADTLASQATLLLDRWQGFADRLREQLIGVGVVPMTWTFYRNHYQ